MTKTYLETLQDKLREIEEQREALLKLIGMETGKPVNGVAFRKPPGVSSTSSIRGRVVDAVIDLINQEGRQVRSDEILAHVEERGLSLGNTKNKDASLAAILSQEIAKKSARLRRVERGVYDLKK